MLSVEVINDILDQIPENKKSGYDKEFINNLYMNYQKNKVDDTLVLESLSRRIADYRVLILGPGQSLVSYKSILYEWINKNNPFIISLNVTPEEYAVDLTFISNAKRFAEHKSRENILVTSNIQDSQLPTLNYGSYINNSEMPDNSLLMLLKCLMRIGVREVYIAGCDGFSHGCSNYFSDHMLSNAKLGEFDRRNKILSAVIKEFSSNIDIHFLTPTLYYEGCVLKHD